MSIEYTYEIISVDQKARCMEIVYRSENRQTMHIGARLPFENEALEDVVASFSPVAYWAEQDAVVIDVAVGTTGKITPQVQETRPAPDVIRGRRNFLLAETDWTQLPDAKLTEQELAKWSAYRQALRDVPQQAGFPDTVVWPSVKNIPVAIL